MSRRPIGWDHPDTARWYARFERRFARYRTANRRLVAHASLGPGLRVLDLGAGGGGTTAAALPHLGGRSEVVCFEPASAMRALGTLALTDARVRWTDAWPVAGEGFDRILCGAAIWQMLPLAATLERAFALLRPGGRLCFDVPALYLGEPDEPGGGSDPLLLALPAALAQRLPQALPQAEPPGDTGPGAGAAAAPVLPDADGLDTLLRAVGFEATRWSFRIRLRQRAYAAWLKIPPTTDLLLLDLDADARAALIDRALASVDASSWKWERWHGWTASRPA